MVRNWNADRTLIMKSAAVPATLYFAASWAFTGEVSLRPKAASAESDWMMYESARHRPCCSGRTFLQLESLATK
jgi:hypothetical protein